MLRAGVPVIYTLYVGKHRASLAASRRLSLVENGGLYALRRTQPGARHRAKGDTVQHCSQECAKFRLAGDGFYV